MDVIFNRSHCDQELSVDAAGAGTEIECPSCGQKIVIPQPPPQAQQQAPPIATSAAAKEEKHFAVPVHSKPTESLIGKPLPPLEAAASTFQAQLLEAVEGNTELASYIRGLRKAETSH